MGAEGGEKNIIRPDFASKNEPRPREGVKNEDGHVVQFEPHLQERVRKKNSGGIEARFSDREMRRASINRIFERDGSQAAHEVARVLIEELKRILEENWSAIERMKKTDRIRMVHTLTTIENYLKKCKESPDHYRKTDMRHTTGPHRGKRLNDLLRIIEHVAWMDGAVKKAMLASANTQ